MISNLEGQLPDDSVMEREVQMVFSEMPDGTVLPRFELAT